MEVMNIAYSGGIRADGGSGDPVSDAVGTQGKGSDR